MPSTLNTFQQVDSGDIGSGAGPYNPLLVNLDDDTSLVISTLTNPITCALVTHPAGGGGTWGPWVNIPTGTGAAYYVGTVRMSSTAVLVLYAQGAAAYAVIVTISGGAPVVGARLQISGPGVAGDTLGTTRYGSDAVFRLSATAACYIQNHRVCHLTIAGNAVTAYRWTVVGAFAGEWHFNGSTEGWVADITSGGGTTVAYDATQDYDGVGGRLKITGGYGDTAKSPLITFPAPVSGYLNMEAFTDGNSNRWGIIGHTASGTTRDGMGSTFTAPEPGYQTLRSYLAFGFTGASGPWTGAEVYLGADSVGFPHDTYVDAVYLWTQADDVPDFVIDALALDGSTLLLIYRAGPVLGIRAAVVTFDGSGVATLHPSIPLPAPGDIIQANWNEAMKLMANGAIDVFVPSFGGPFYFLISVFRLTVAGTSVTEELLASGELMHQGDHPIWLNQGALLVAEGAQGAPVDYHYWPANYTNGDLAPDALPNPPGDWPTNPSTFGGGTAPIRGDHFLGLSEYDTSGAFPRYHLYELQVIPAPAACLDLEILRDLPSGFWIPGEYNAATHRIPARVGAPLLQTNDDDYAYQNYWENSFPGASNPVNIQPFRSTFWFGSPFYDPATVSEIVIFFRVVRMGNVTPTVITAPAGWTSLGLLTFFAPQNNSSIYTDAGPRTCTYQAFRWVVPPGTPDTYTASFAFDVLDPSAPSEYFVHAFKQGWSLFDADIIKYDVDSTRPASSLPTDHPWVFTVQDDTPRGYYSGAGVEYLGWTPTGSAPDQIAQMGGTGQSDPSPALTPPPMYGNLGAWETERFEGSAQPVMGVTKQPAPTTATEEYEGWPLVSLQMVYRRNQSLNPTIVTGLDLTCDACPSPITVGLQGAGDAIQYFYPAGATSTYYPGMAQWSVEFIAKFGADPFSTDYLLNPIAQFARSIDMEPVSPTTAAVAGLVQSSAIFKIGTGGCWYHAVLTRETDGSARFYVNGTLIGTYPTAYSGYDPLLAFHMSAQVYLAALYDHALTAARVAAHVAHLCNPCHNAGWAGQQLIPVSAQFRGLTADVHKVKPR